jgi:hypothetical protein
MKFLTLLASLSAIFFLLSGCGPREIIVDFKQGTTPARVDAINLQIGAFVINPPQLKSSLLYLIGLPPIVSWDAAAAFYESRPEVAGVLPANSYQLF